MQHIKWMQNPYKQAGTMGNETAVFSKEEIKNAVHFHSSMPEYTPTPLHTLTDLAASLGVKDIYVKDESKRFGLHAFKGLGASYAMASYFAKERGLHRPTMSLSSVLEHVQSEPVSTIATVTAGNHGKGVAWAAQLFGQRAKVYMPKGTSPARVEAIETLDAEVFVTELNYDDTVQHVAELASTHGWILMQDTAWDGYEMVPRFIMQGYTTIVGEIAEQLKSIPLDKLTHVFLQAGVGSFAGAIAAAIYQLTDKSPPKIVIVEPSKADCFYQSAVHATGEAQRVHGNLATMMAGLACGEPSPIGWNIIKPLSDYFFSCDDVISAKGMRLLANPIGQDVSIVSGESGAVPIGLLNEIMSNGNAREIKTTLELNDISRILVINTEGNTDPVNYRKIITDQ